MERSSDVLRGCRRVHVVVDDDVLAAIAAADEVLTGAAGPQSMTACCAGKRRYGEAAARRAARILIWAQGEDVHAYACPFGRHWHVGHRPVPRRDDQDGAAITPAARAR